MTIYEEMRGVTASLLDEFKQGTMSYVQITPGAGPIDNPGASTETAIAFNGTMRGVSARYVDGTNVLASDLQVTMAGRTGFAPALRDLVAVDGVRYKIVKILNKPAAGVAVAHVLIVRR